MAFFASVMVFFLWLCVSRCIRNSWRKKQLRKQTQYLQSQQQQQLQHVDSIASLASQNHNQPPCYPGFHDSNQQHQQPQQNYFVESYSHQPSNSTTPHETPMHVKLQYDDTYDQLIAVAAPVPAFDIPQSSVPIIHPVPHYGFRAIAVNPVVSLTHDNIASYPITVPNLKEECQRSDHETRLAIYPDDRTSQLDDNAVLSSSSVSPTLSGGYYSAPSTSSTKSFRTYTPKLDRRDRSGSGNFSRLVFVNGSSTDYAVSDDSQVYNKSQNKSVEVTV